MSENVTMYYAKINLNSSQIFDVYDGKIELIDILKMLTDSISEDIKHTRVVMKNNVQIYKATYRFEEIEKDNNNLYVYGALIKESNLYVNQRNRNNKRIKVPVLNEERIQFFMDLKREAIAYLALKVCK